MIRAYVVHPDLHATSGARADLHDDLCQRYTCQPGVWSTAHVPLPGTKLCFDQCQGLQYYHRGLGQGNLNANLMHGQGVEPETSEGFYLDPRWAGCLLKDHY